MPDDPRLSALEETTARHTAAVSNLAESSIFQHIPDMTKAMNLSVRLTEPLSDYVAGRVGTQGDYDNASEYVRDLIRRDREREERRVFRRLKATLQDAFAQPDEDAIEMDFARFKARQNTQR